jgi:tellurite resistance protein TehA-like permease
LGLSYTFFVAVTFCEPKPTLESGINGAWLLSIVAIESISVLGALVAPGFRQVRVVIFVSFCTFLVGAMLYMFFATLIMYRWMFFRMKPERLTPDYWIDMGALAITTLAGALLLESSGRSELLQALAPFLTGATFFFWATATWWIPLLLLVELWRHTRGGVAFRYGPEYWALVFPLGMYATATAKLVQVTKFSPLAPMAHVFTCIALAAWAIVFAGMLHHLTRRQRRSMPS